MEMRLIPYDKAFGPQRCDKLGADGFGDAHSRLRPWKDCGEGARSA
jgi:hypothetical protein